MKVYSPDREWPEPYRKVLKELEEVVDPVTGGSVLESGVIAGLEVTEDTLRIWLNFESHAEYNLTGASAMAYSRIIGDIMERFALVRFDRVYVYDLSGNPVGVFDPGSKGKGGG